MESYRLRPAKPEDHDRIIGVLPEWWGGRDLRAMLPRLFLLHFHPSCLIAEVNGGLAGFLIGFDSQAYPEEAYIHFAGVHPDHRRSGLGRRLYERFFERCRQVDRQVVRACTSPVNRASIAFHRSLGFQLETGDRVIDGVPVCLDYNQPGDPKVRFRIDLRDDSLGY